MARSKWEDLLPASGSGGRSRSDLLGQLAESTAGGSVAGSGATHSLSGVQSNSSMTDQLTVLASQITSLTSVQQEQISALQDNTQAVAQNSSSRSGSGSSVATTAESAASSFLGGGLLSSLSPLVGGILSLFGGGGGQALAVPPPFMLPYPVQSQVGVSAGTLGQISPVSYGETGQPRAQAANASPQVTVQVNAMDSQSFLDHSDDIAMAVKQALLNSSSLKDVIAEL